MSSIATPTAYEIWGDDTLFTGADGGAGVTNTSEAAQLSQQALSQILGTGGTSISIEQIRQRFPTRAGPSASAQQNLATWNQSQAEYCKETSFPAFGAKLKSILLNLASPRLGVVSQDQAFATVWSTSLPDCRWNPVHTVVAAGRLFTGSNGYVYELDPQTGAVLHELLVTGTVGAGNYTTRLATDGTSLFVGVHGYVYSVSLSNWSKTAWNLGVGSTGYNPVDVLVYGSRLFAGCNGYVYEINPASGAQIHSLLVSSRFGAGNYTTRLATDGKNLYAGVHGYVYGVPLSNWSSSAWNTGVGSTGYNPVSVLVYGSRLFAGCNGYVYEINPVSGAELHSLLVSGRVGAGNYDTKVATDGMTLFAGVHGYVYGVPLNNWSASVWNTAVGGTLSYEPVSVLTHNGRLFAASNGYVYSSTGIRAHGAEPASHVQRRRW